MNFDFSEDVGAMREEVRRILSDKFPRGEVRQAVDAGRRFDRDFWALLGEMGWLGVAIPEEHGGSALGYEALCMIAEEVGAALPPVPFISTILAAEALTLFGSDAQRAKWLPRLATGEAVGCLALAGELPVVDGDIADIAIVARDGDLWLVELDQPGVVREPIEALDAVRTSVRLTFTAAEKLSGDLSRFLDRAAILVAFEQVGGTRAALDMAVGYAQERYAFGRAIASFQAIKHKLADIYVALELARSNAYYGAYALEDEADLPVAASAARLAASEAYSLAAKENIHTHGGMGFTWESDCHLHYRRARELAVGLHSSRYWRDRLISHLDKAAA
ncbi:acyl-CoA/acyl-ACP dehydrogenase [Sphingomonas sp. AOB5]|uniref:acyl-CoA dehydrogenase family protein n=1 Tax=Sphingomonas sp. AOB5 TaxID=3034017 RepID=UPI0023F8901A|nr:acyl-CoA dehydrogenase family protein [Sphingomonas sp. AOB5]MDF7774775.1 acyl-CoA/acyl-ACP dehydrogenase [Sphingomonas sp. AOB5]